MSMEKKKCSILDNTLSIGVNKKIPFSEGIQETTWEYADNQDEPQFG